MARQVRTFSELALVAWSVASHALAIQAYPLPSSGAAYYFVAVARAVHTFSMRTLPSWHNPGKANTPPVRLDFVFAKIAQQLRSVLRLQRVSPKLHCARRAGSPLPVHAA